MLIPKEKKIWQQPFSQRKGAPERALKIDKFVSSFDYSVYGNYGINSNFYALKKY